MKCTEVQWNFIADILYSGQPSILNSTTDNFLRNRWKDVQTFIKKPLCSGHHSIANIIFMFRITLLPRTPNNRPYKKHLYILLLRFTVSFKFSSIFVISSLASLMNFSGQWKEKITGISIPYSPPCLQVRPKRNGAVIET